MIINKDTLSEVFGTEVVRYEPLPTGFGLHVELDHLTDIGRPFISSFESGKVVHRHPRLLELTHRYDLIVVANARMEAVPNAISTGHVSKGGLKLQDFFHYDSQPDGSLEGTVTALFKPKTKAKRLKPTVYTTVAALCGAVKRVDLDAFDVLSGIKDMGKKYLARMADGSYGFSIRAEEAGERNFVRMALPHLTAEVVKLIPATDLFANSWDAGAQTVLLHSNRAKSNLRHAREHGIDELDPLDSLVLQAS